MTQQNERALELTKLLAAECGSTQDVATLLKSLFAGTIEQMLEAEMAEHLGYSKHSMEGNNSGNSRNGYNKKTIKSEWGAGRFHLGESQERKCKEIVDGSDFTFSVNAGKARGICFECGKSKFAQEG